MQKLDHFTLKDRAYDAIKQGLISGQFAPGEPLVIRKLAEMLGISTTPIREALQRLVAERVLEMNAARSIFVPRLTSETFDELTDIRISVEGVAAHRAAGRINADDLVEIRVLLGGMERAIACRDAALYNSMNEAFHFAIYKHAEAPILLNIIEDLWVRVGPYLKLLLDTETYIPEANSSHQKIVAALEAGNGLSARSYIDDDISRAAIVLARVLREATKAPDSWNIKTEI